MKKNIIIMLASLFSMFSSSAQEAEKSIYQITAKSIQGDMIPMERYKGKHILIINTASKCGFTSQYDGLEYLHKTYKNKGLVVLGFPCNQFLNQEPGGAQDIQDFCRINYGVSFQLFEKIDVNGKNEHPLYSYLKSAKKGKIQWNFTKFLVNPDGTVIKRYGSRVKPRTIEKDIKKLL